MPGDAARRRPRPPWRFEPGFSITEVIFAVAIGLVILSVAYWTLVSSSRIVTRGQNKMFDTTQSELVMRYLEEDLHTLREAPLVADQVPQLVLYRYTTAGPARVEWHFIPSPGKGHVERVSIAGSQPARSSTDRFLTGSLHEVKVRSLAVPDHPGLALKLVCMAFGDSTPAVFERVFFFQNQILDPLWNPIPIQ